MSVYKIRLTIFDVIWNLKGNDKASINAYFVFSLITYFYRIWKLAETYWNVDRDRLFVFKKPDNDM